MSEDNVLGNACCCIPRRMFVAILALCWTLYGASICIFWMVWVQFNGDPPPRPCAGHRCMKAFTCEGMIDATVHIREPWLVIGGLVFGALGFYGAWDVQPKSLRYFALWQLATAGFFVFLYVWDGFYLNLCGGYSRNVVDQTITGWDVPRSQEDKVKQLTLQKMEAYPRHATNRYVDGNLWWYYTLFALGVATILFYCSHVTMVLSKLYVEGPTGLGVNYRLGTWRAEVLLKQKMREIETQLEDNVDDIEDAIKEEARDMQKDFKAASKGHYGATK